MSLTTTADRIVIRRRWLRSKHWFLLFIIGGADAYVLHLWTTVGPSAWLIVGTLFVLSWSYLLPTMLRNTTAITASADGVRVKHGPLPSPFARNAAAERGRLEQLYATTFGAAFAVEAKLTSGPPLRLVAPLITADQALFVEQTLEQALGLADFAVEGELGQAPPPDVDGKQPTGAGAAAALALLIPLGIAGAVAFMVSAFTPEVSGRLQATGALGAWVFEPNDCDSGQLEGFGGVTLKSSRAKGRVVRLVKDPVRGSLVVIASPGAPNHVISAETCPGLELDVQRGSTNINDVWTQDGNVSLRCPELSGSVTFEGCH
ncbi:MAG: hypothetical protein FJ104_10905 [Deltaproteobacteria bacterium]|nr:hypothetical protein [Deltaproteobacteria bacterium]